MPDKRNLLCLAVLLVIVSVLEEKEAGNRRAAAQIGGSPQQDRSLTCQVMNVRR